MQEVPDQPKPGWKLCRRREVRLPTWRGCLLLLALLAALAICTGRVLRSFLAINAPLPGGVLVVEGWAPDYALQEAIDEFHRHPYDKLYVTGGPLEVGVLLSEYKTYAERGAALLRKMGLATNQVQAVPAPHVRQDRTYTAAVSLAQWFAAQGFHPAKVYLVTEDAHARRSRLLYHKAFGKSAAIGVMSVPSIDYDTEHWWRSSAGVRTVVGEMLAYGYARLLFWPPSSMTGA